MINEDVNDRIIDFKVDIRMDSNHLLLCLKIKEHGEEENDPITEAEQEWEEEIIDRSRKEKRKVKKMYWRWKREKVEREDHLQERRKFRKVLEKKRREKREEEEELRNLRRRNSGYIKTY
ncbi:hypothetical protein ALC56_05415 [Trachymyrmex septentrionalis]|uniref:Uncharacterized protein n=1 Tax=Trachymyrmex septentrionalis TaxID=34720 RepID=A0A195FIH6_9HYME|nr:hypothetical protein ALC56_05415 [Trachymyrmex septentrionalis]